MDDARLDRIERRMEELDQRSSALERTVDRAMDRSRAAMNSVIPSETQRHMRAAWRENLLAVRSFIDYWVDRLDDAPDAKKPGESNSGRENIRIE
jgi:hypothetical protein